MAQTETFTWPQGEDLTIELIYKEGPTAATAVAVDLSTGYAVRMDLVVPGTNEVIYTFNSEDIPDVDPLTAGSQPDTVTEGTMSSGAGGTANISIVVSRALTLPGGAVYQKMTEAPPVLSFNTDIFLRNTVSNRQAKILTATVNVEKSYTLWL